MEIVQKDGKPDGRIQPRGGSVRPIVEAKLENDRLLIVVQKATDRTPEVAWDLTVASDKLSGTQKQGQNETKIDGIRAPELKKPMPTAWSAPNRSSTAKT